MKETITITPCEGKGGLEAVRSLISRRDAYEALGKATQETYRAES